METKGSDGNIPGHNPRPQATYRCCFSLLILKENKKEYPFLIAIAQGFLEGRVPLTLDSSSA